MNNFSTEPGTRPISTDPILNGQLPENKRSKQPVAIIGYACRLPGDVSSPNDLWELCTRKRSGWSKIPKDRFSSEAFHHPNPSKVGTFNPAGGYFLQDDISRFDAPFFNISTQEAISMDPQQRLLLECSYEALESAGLPKESLAGRNVGVFVGGNFADYELNNVRDVETIPMYQSTGCAPSLQSNRISYFFDFRGPSFTVDTACSSSLVALHNAVRSLQNEESSEALVAGCRLNIVPDLFVSMSMSQLFNDDGKTYSFDDRAKSGFARGEGAGVVLLKPLDAAIRDQDPIRAVIANSGLSQDGRTQGITLPNVHAQEQLMSRVYREVDIKPEECGFVEMHGTGTKVGDPIEAAAVRAALGNGRTARDPLYIGSVKSNVGHLEGASGIISVIKAAMMLDNGLLLPNADFQKVNQNIPLSEWNMKVVTSTRPFPRGKKYVSVSNYGFGGTNGHVVLERPPLEAKLATTNDKDSLQARIKDFCIYFEQRPEVFEKMLFGNFAYTLGSKLSQLAYRVALSASSLDELGVRLAQLKVNPARVLGSPSIGFIFTGQGAQWAQMGVPLMAKYPIFASAIERADACLRSIGASFSLVDELGKDATSSEIDSPHLSQPACTALQIALVMLLDSWGIRPSSVVGHSSGEIGAAYAAGVYDLESAMSLAYHRGRMTRLLKEKCPELKGGMLAVGVGAEIIRQMLKMLRGGYATIACINSPTSVTVSGDLQAIQELEEALQSRQIFNRKLKIDVAYHSDHMRKIAEPYFSAISSIQPKSTSSATFYSSVEGCIIDPSSLGAAYWVQNLVSSVLFSEALGKMCSSDGRPNLLVEIGPHSALKGPAIDILKHLGPTSSKVAYTPTIVRKVDPIDALFDTARAAYVRGAKLDMNAVNFPSSGAKNNAFLTDLPRYPWQHGTRYWHEARIAQNHSIRDGAIRNDILGVVANYSNDLEPTWRNIVRLDDIPWLRDHKMQGMVVYPLAGYLSMAVEAAKFRAQKRNQSFYAYKFREVVVESALVISNDVNIETTISLRPYDEGTRGSSDLWDEFKIHSWTSKRGWIQHCRGLVGVRSKQTNNALEIFSADKRIQEHILAEKAKIRTASVNDIQTDHLYKVLTELGAEYGPTFQGLENTQADSHHSHADLYIRDTARVMPKGFQPELAIHPALLDGLLHLVWPILGHGKMDLETLYMPTLIKEAIISRNIPSSPGQYIKAYGTGNPHLPWPEPTHFDLFATQDDSSEPLIMLDGLVMTPIRDLGLGQQSEARKLCYKFEWLPLVETAVPSNGIEPRQETSSDGEFIQTDGTIHTNGVTTEQESSKSDTTLSSNGTIVIPSTNGHLECETTIMPNRFHASNGINGHAIANKDGHASKDIPNGTGEFAINELSGDKFSSLNGVSTMNLTNSTPAEATNGIITDKRNLLIANFGNSNLQSSISIAQELSAGPVLEIDELTKSTCTEKNVIIIQSPLSSLRNITASQFECIKTTLLNAANVLWIYQTNTPDAHMTVGLTRSVRSETMAKVSTLGLDTEEPNAASSVIRKTIGIIWSANGAETCPDFEFKSKGADLHVLRAVEDDSCNTFIHNEVSDFALSLQPFHQPGRRFKLGITNPGSLDTIYFADDDAPILEDNSVEVEVKATGINFKDIVVSMGQLNQPYIGVECSGIVSSVGKNVNDIKIGEKVMCMPEGAYSTYARCLSTSVIPIPEILSLEEAATVPIVFCTAYYGLFDLGRLEASERVLIHAGAGGVGQAAIQLAQMAGADVFVTVGNRDKKLFVMEKYSIPENRIFYSRDSSFGKAVRQATNGEGVDVVLNSLAGDLLRETWECVAPFGRFIEIGKADITKNSRLDMLKFEYNVTFASVDLTKVAKYKPKLMNRLLNDVSQLITKQKIKPIFPITKFRISELEMAFRTLQTGKNMGKSVVVHDGDDLVKAVALKAGPGLLRSDATYIIVGGVGGLGRAMAKWMSQKGARNIVLTSRNASVSNEVQVLIDEVRVHSTRILVKACDITSNESVNNLVREELKDLPPVRGVVHGAMVLRDMLFEQMAFNDFETVASCKVEGAWNLHYNLAGSPLDFFIALSSVAGVVGNRGQAAYAAANVFLDGFMEYRRSQNLPGASIDLAAVTDVGYLADSDPSRRQEVLKNVGSSVINESEVLAFLALAITGELKKSSHRQYITGLEIMESADSFWIHDPKFQVLRDAAGSNLKYSDSTGQSIPLSVALKTASSKEEALELCFGGLVVKLAEVLGLSADDMDTLTRLSSLGLDSLVAIEIRNWIAREADANVQVLELLSSESLSHLSELIITKSKLVFKF